MTLIPKWPSLYPTTVHQRNYARLLQADNEIEVFWNGQIWTCKIQANGKLGAPKHEQMQKPIIDARHGNMGGITVLRKKCKIFGRPEDLFMKSQHPLYAAMLDMANYSIGFEGWNGCLQFLVYYLLRLI